MSAEQQIETAVESLIRAAAGDFPYELAVITSCVETNDSERDVAYPCIVAACAPFVPDTPGSPLGYCSLTVTCMTEQNDDKFGMALNRLCVIAFPQVTKSGIGPKIQSPWLLCGINDTGPSEVNVDEDTNVNIRGREFQVALADMTGALTTTTTGG
jgi:hypothetical protein